MVQGLLSRAAGQDARGGKVRRARRTENASRGPSMIDGVQITPLKRIQDERGMVMHMLRADDPHFDRFGEIYFSVIYPEVIKAWHLPSRMTINYAVVDGNIKLVLY